MRKTYIQNISEALDKIKEPSYFPWMSDFREFRDKKLECFPWSATFAEIRGVDKPRVSEAITYNTSFHDDDSVKPKNITSEQSRAIVNYTSMKSADVECGHGSSKNVNGYLFNRMGHRSRCVEHHEPEDVLNSVKTLSSAFTKENTNRKPITTYGAIPKQYGNTLEKSKSGTIHRFPGFTSTSSDYRVAKDFAHMYADELPEDMRECHIVKYTVNPGAGLSVVRHSDYPEDEILIHHGTHVEYSHTEDKDIHGTRTKIHHVTAHNKHIPLTEYGVYSDIAKRTQ